MPTRKPKNPELSQAVDSLNEAAQHVRNAVQGKIDQVRGAAAAELAKAKAVARKQTSAAHAKLEVALNRAEARLHKVIAGGAEVAGQGSARGRQTQRSDGEEGTCKEEPREEGHAGREVAGAPRAPVQRDDTAMHPASP